MSKRDLLWWLGAIALGFTYIAAVNVTVAGTNSLTGQSFRFCGGTWNPLDWFDSSCSDALPPRLGVMAIGAAVLLVCGYFAEKNNPDRAVQAALAARHRIDKLPGRNEWLCKTCGFVTGDHPIAMRHFEDGSRGLPTASGSGTATTPEFKLCPDCAEKIQATARKCRFCGYMFDHG